MTDVIYQHKDVTLADQRLWLTHKHTFPVSNWIYIYREVSEVKK